MDRDVEQFMRELGALVGRKIQVGLSGVNINAFKRGEPEVLVIRHHEMSEYVANLAGQLYRRRLLNDHKAWVHWMTDAAILHPSGDNVTVYHRTPFFVERARDLFGEALDIFFKCKVVWRPSEEIAKQVERQHG